MYELGHFIDGVRVSGEGEQRRKIYDPARGVAQGQLRMANSRDIDAAIESALKGFLAWSQFNPQRRARVMFRFKELLERDKDKLARLLSSEHGKILADSHGDLQRGLEVIEFACGIPHLQKGEFSESAGPCIDVYSMRQPLGVCVGITPFNFPAMIPMWMFGVAIAAGNSMIIKPSEKDPSVPLHLAELMVEAGAPAGVLNVLNGDKVAVDGLIDDPRVQAISFVGSSDIAAYIYSRSAQHGKRVQCFGGAKNHLVVMPDADIDNAVNQVMGAAYGSAGERCMATPVLVPVGDGTADQLLEALKPRVENLKIGHWDDPESEIGPLVTREHHSRVRSYIDMAVREGQRLVVDGRDFVSAGHKDGFFMGGSLLDGARPEHQSYVDEIFGPVLQVIRAADLEEAIALPSNHQYGNGVAIFTSDGSAARAFVNRVNVGMVGINVPIPVPVSYYSFGGWKRSGFGDTNQYGTEGVKFWTRLKTVTQRWQAGAQAANFSIPTHS